MKNKKPKRHWIRVQYQIGERNIYSEAYTATSSEGLTVQEFFFQLVSFLNGVRPYINDENLYAEVCSTILKDLIRKAKASTMDYFSTKQSITKLKIEHKFQSRKNKGERIDIELVTTLLKYKDDNSIISKVINIFKNV